MRQFSRSMGASVALAAILAAGTAAAQTTVNGPYYAMPSWDQTLPAASRFLVLSNFDNQAVLDRETGLVWQRSPIRLSIGFSFAYTFCAGSAVGGRGGWRLPSIGELNTLFDPAATTGPGFPAGHPFTGFPPASGTPVYLWSTTRTSDGADFFATSYFTFVGTFSLTLANSIPATTSAAALCVRAPGNNGTF